MPSLVATTIQPAWPTRGTLRWMLVIGILQVATGVISAALGWPLAMAPLWLAIVFVCGAFPRIGLVILMAAMFSGHPLPGTTRIFVSDVLTVPAIIGMLVRRLSATDRRRSINPLITPLVCILIYFGFCALRAPHMWPSLVNWLRHVQLVALGLLIAETVEPEDIQRILKVMVGLTFVLAVYNIVEFVSLGGTQRVFGPSGGVFTWFLAVSLIYAYVAALFSRSWTGRILWGLAAAVFFLGQVANQTRAAMVHELNGVLIVSVAAWVWGHKHNAPAIRRRVLFLTIAVAAMVIIVMFGKFELFGAATRRVEQAIEGHSGTIALRFVLWKTGLAAFSESPIFGMGLAEASRWGEQFDFFRLGTYASLTRGLGVHNDFIRYLGETGLIGTGLIFWFFYRLIRMARSTWRLAYSQARARDALLLIGPIGAIILHYFYSADLFYAIAGMIFAFYYGMLVSYHSALLAVEPTGFPDEGAIGRSHS